MCIDSRVMNKITIGYQLYISRLDDLLDHGVIIFLKINLKGGYD